LFVKGPASEALQKMRFGFGPMPCAALNKGLRVLRAAVLPGVLPALFCGAAARAAGGSAGRRQLRDHTGQKQGAVLARFKGNNTRRPLFFVCVLAWY
jgi:hypothetical protein